MTKKTPAEILAKLSFCGCDTPDNAYQTLKDTLKMFESPEDPVTSKPVEAKPESQDKVFDTKILANMMQLSPQAEARYKQIKDWIEAAPTHHLLLYILEGLDLLEHGSNIRFSWLSQDGRTLLEFFEKHGCEYKKWPDEVYEEIGYPN